MGHFVNASELAELCCELDLLIEEAALITATNHVGCAIAAKLDIVFLEASNQPGFGGLCASFGPSFNGQKCPASLKELDPSSDWASE